MKNAFLFALISIFMPSPEKIFRFLLHRFFYWSLEVDDGGHAIFQALTERLLCVADQLLVDIKGTSQKVILIYLFIEKITYVRKRG